MSNACSSPVIRVAVLFLEPTGKSRSMTLKSSVLMEVPSVGAIGTWWVSGRSGRAGNDGQASIDVVRGGGTDGNHGRVLAFDDQQRGEAVHAQRRRPLEVRLGGIGRRGRVERTDDRFRIDARGFGDPR